MNIFTVEELYKEYEKFGYLKSIENVEGIYKIYMPDNFVINIKDTTDAISEHDNRSMLYGVQKLSRKWNNILRTKGYEDGLLYIGKAEKSKNRGLQSRITELIRYGYKEVDNHRGGRAIWQLENNKQLLIKVIDCDNPKIMKRDELIKYKEMHGEYPFANWSL